MEDVADIGQDVTYGEEKWENKEAYGRRKLGQQPVTEVNRSANVGFGHVCGNIIMNM